MRTEEYKDLIESFVHRKIPAAEFELRYLAGFKAESGGMHPRLFAILDRLFGDVDAYSPDCLPGEESTFRISESKLRQQAELALKDLGVFLREPIRELVPE